MDINRSLVIIKFIAIILITNSHMDSLYPIQLLASGGALGNSLFFFASGLGVTLSKKPATEKFTVWYKRRLVRIYYPMWLALGVYLYFDRVFFGDFFTTLKLVVYPKEFWFLPVLALFYIPLYFIVKHYRHKAYAYTFYAFLIVYFIWYFFSYDENRFSVEDYGLFKTFFYFIVVSLGVYAGKNRVNFFKRDKYDVLTLCLLLSLYVGIKFFLLTTNMYEWQFTAQLILMPLVVYFSKVLASDYNFLTAIYSGIKKKIIVWISILTLEIYLLQSLVFHSEIINGLFFPKNVIVSIGLILLFSFLFQQSHARIKDFLQLK